MIKKPYAELLHYTKHCLQPKKEAQNSKRPFYIWNGNLLIQSNPRHESRDHNYDETEAIKQGDI